MTLEIVFYTGEHFFNGGSFLPRHSLGHVGKHNNSSQVQAPVSGQDQYVSGECSVDLEKNKREIYMNATDRK